MHFCDRLRMIWGGGILQSDIIFLKHLLILSLWVTMVSKYNIRTSHIYFSFLSMIICNVQMLIKPPNMLQMDQKEKCPRGHLHIWRRGDATTAGPARTEEKTGREGRGCAFASRIFHCARTRYNRMDHIWRLSMRVNDVVCFCERERERGRGGEAWDILETRFLLAVVFLPKNVNRDLHKWYVIM